MVGTASRPNSSPAPGEKLFLRNPAHPGAVCPTVGGEVAEKWTDFCGDGGEDSFTFYGVSLRGLAAESVRDDIGECAEDADRFVRLLVWKIDRPFEVRQLGREVEDHRHF